MTSAGHGHGPASRRSWPTRPTSVPRPSRFRAHDGPVRGYFTAALVDGLRGGAVDERTGVVDANSLAAFLYRGGPGSQRRSPDPLHHPDLPAAGAPPARPDGPPDRVLSSRRGWLASTSTTMAAEPSPSPSGSSRSMSLPGRYVVRAAARGRIAIQACARGGRAGPDPARASVTTRRPPRSSAPPRSTRAMPTSWIGLLATPTATGAGLVVLVRHVDGTPTTPAVPVTIAVGDRDVPLQWVDAAGARCCAVELRAGLCIATVGGDVPTAMAVPVWSDWRTIVVVPVVAGATGDGARRPPLPADRRSVGGGAGERRFSPRCSSAP